MESGLFKQSPYWGQRFILVASILAFLVSARAGAVTINNDTTIEDNISGVALFGTTGSLMAGTQVTAIFNNGTNETKTWKKTPGVDESGGASGTGWSLDVTGDTFFQPWIFENNTGGAFLETLIINGGSGFTVFDRTFGGLDGTPDSKSGFDFAPNPLEPLFDAEVTYSRVVSVGLNAAVVDLFNVVTIDLTKTSGGPSPGLNTSFSFFQDSDSDIAITIPEPAPIILISLTFGLFGFAHRKRKINN